MIIRYNIQYFISFRNYEILIQFKESSSEVGRVSKINPTILNDPPVYLKIILHEVAQL